MLAWRPSTWMGHVKLRKQNPETKSRGRKGLSVGFRIGMPQHAASTARWVDSNYYEEPNRGIETIQGGSKCESYSEYPPRFFCFFSHKATMDPFYWHWSSLIPSWISNYSHCKVWHEITHSSPNFNGTALGVWEWISNFIPHFTVNVIIYPCWTQGPFSIELLKWRHIERDGVSNHQPHDCLLNRLFRRKSKKTSKLRVSGLCEGNSPVTGDH